MAPYAHCIAAESEVSYEKIPNLSRRKRASHAHERQPVAGMPHCRPAASLALMLRRKTLRIGLLNFLQIQDNLGAPSDAPEMPQTRQISAPKPPHRTHRLEPIGAATRPTG
jgi:hypothetical protein